MNKSKELQEFQKAFPSEEKRQAERVAYRTNLKLYLEGKIKECPQCGQDNGHHKMDCGVRYERLK